MVIKRNHPNSWPNISGYFRLVNYYKLLRSMSVSAWRKTGYVGLKSRSTDLNFSQEPLLIIVKGPICVYNYICLYIYIYVYIYNRYYIYSTFILYYYVYIYIYIIVYLYNFQNQTQGALLLLLTNVNQTYWSRAVALESLHFGRPDWHSWDGTRSYQVRVFDPTATINKTKCPLSKHAKGKPIFFL